MTVETERQRDATRSLPHRSRGGAYRPSRTMRLMLSLGHRLEIGTLDVVLPDGETRRFGGRAAGPAARLEIHRDRLARRFLTGGNLGFCEAYLDGDWSSPDPEALFVFFLVNRDHIAGEMAGRPWVRLAGRIAHAFRANTRAGAKRNIAKHYDLGNAFYETWLDPTMTYSSAVFDDGAGDAIAFAPTPDDAGAARDLGATLAAAQTAKYQRLCEVMGLERGQSVLEIGCGWGGFAEHAAREYDARVTAITISREQHDYARKRVHEAGLADRVEVRLQDYRDVEGRFDRIASIEMFEAVGAEYWARFFAGLRDRLAPGGVAGLQVITIADRYFDDYRRGADYIQRYVFPGGMLPSPAALDREVAAAGLTTGRIETFGGDYAATLRAWNRRFQVAWPGIRAMGFDDRFKRLWEQYLAYCAAGFGVGTIDVRQMAVHRP